MMKTVELSRSKLLEVLHISAKKNKVVRPTYLSSDEEALAVAEANIEGSLGLPINTVAISDELKCVV